MKKGYFNSLIIFFLLGGFVFAQEGVVFPVEELGGCRTFKECADFCDKSENFKVCTDFAEANGMVAPEEAGQARKMLEIVEMGGPGGCQSQGECETYCNIPEHMEECIVFAKENNLIPPEELKEAEMALAAIRKGAEPPPCRGKTECDIYCSQPEHLEECITFGEAAGFISADEAAMVRKTGGKGPGGCRGKDECEAYCEDPANMEQCINFGIEYGLMPPEEIEEAKMMLKAIKKGVKPPNCRSREECDVYCSQPEHAEECVNFAVAAGFMNQEEAEEAKKMMKLGIMGGPGDCKGKEECEAYCDEPDHMLECVEFAEKAGFMSPEEAEQAKKMAEMGVRGGPGGCKSPEECDTYCSQPEHQEECFEFGVKAGFISPEEVERARKMGELEKMGGPGGCKSQEECDEYCSQPEHMEECMEFGKKEGLISPEEAEKAKEFRAEGPGGPGGCRSKKECELYCSDLVHMEECLNFKVEQGHMPREEAEEMRKMMEMPPEKMMPPGEEMMPQPREMPPFPEGPPSEGYPEEFPPEGPYLEEKPPEGMPPMEEKTIEERPPEEFIKPPEEMMSPSGEMRPPEEEKMPPPEETAPPEEITPQSLLKLLPDFLANLASPFLKLE